MNLISGIHIEGFRSILNERIDNIGDFACLVGMNNSGKSNVLRALNLFLTDETEPGVDFDMSRDYHADPRRKKKREIKIAVDFNLPDSFRFRKGIKHLDDELGRKFTIQRTWTADPEEPKFGIRKRGRNFKKLPDWIFWQFVDLIRFRYVQNRVIPSQTLKEEAHNFRAAVWNRLRIKRAAEADRLLGELNQAASDTIEQANEIVTGDVSSIRRLVMGSPELTTLFGLSGFGAEIPTGAIISDDALGAGSQAYMMFLLLKLIDTSYGGTFGWRQGVVWAVEEPESSLHSDLTRKLATMLRTWTEDANTRMQIIATTHSEIVTTTANTGYLVELEDGTRTTVQLKNIPDLVLSATTAGISGKIDPVLCFPTNTVVLVEGTTNRKVLEHVSKTTRAARECVFLGLNELDVKERRSGIDNLLDYLKKWAKLIPNRPENSPLIILFDHDIEEDKLQKARKLYGKNGDRRVLCMDTSHADDSINENMRGIERFYPKSLYLKARGEDMVPVNENQHGKVSIDKKNLTAAVKNELANMFCSGNANWCKPLKLVLEDVVSASL